MKGSQPRLHIEIPNTWEFVMMVASPPNPRVGQTVSVKAARDAVVWLH